MSDLDVRHLTDESLPESPFPVSAQMDFRLYLSPEVHQGIAQHARQDTSVEICGVLVGLWHQDADGPYAVVEDIIRCESATSKFAEVTFTHESWAQINQEMDTKFEDKRIVGWYHSHPDFGIFLSDRDCFIHEHFFSGAGQVAYVVDPVRDLEGAFAWKDNKPTPISHYWVGKTIRTVEASTSNPAAKAADSGSPTAPTAGGDLSGTSQDWSSYSFATTALACLALFLLGYLFSGWQSSWERRAILEGVITNYNFYKGAKLGLRQELEEVEKYLEVLALELKSMPMASKDLTDEQVEDLKKVRRLLVQTIAEKRNHLQLIKSRYGYSEAEQEIINALLQQQLAEQERLLKEAEKAKEEAEQKSKSEDKQSAEESKADAEIDETAESKDDDENDATASGER